MPGQRWLVLATFAAAMVSIWLGTIVTGSGPHAGDANAPRTGFDLVLVSRIHSLSAWAVVALTALCLFVFIRTRQDRPKKAARLLLITVAAQGVVGYIQYFFGLPALVVGLHMVGITLITAAASWLLLSTRRNDGHVEAAAPADARRHTTYT